MMTRNTARKVSRYVFFSGPYFPVLGLNTGKCRPEKNSAFGHFSGKENYAYNILGPHQVNVAIK